MNSICNEGHCVKLGSVSVKKNATAPAACETFYIYNGTCQKGPVLISHKKDNKFICSGTNNTCNYSLKNGHKLTRHCQCGMNPEGNSYCNPGEGYFDIKPVFLL